MSGKGISVIIPTLDRADYAYQTVQDMLSQDFDEFEIIVVDQSDIENDKIKSLAANTNKKLNYYKVNFKGLPNARNYAFQKAMYDILLYVDDDIRCEPELLKEHFRMYKDDSIGAVAGGITEKNKASDAHQPTGAFSYVTATSYRGYSRSGEFEVEHFPGGNFSVKKILLEKIGGFDENLNVGAALHEETDASLRLKKEGVKIVFNSKAHVLHLAAPMGGCREPDWNNYIFALARNRTIIILRYLNPIFFPIAIVRMVLLILSYTRTHRNLKYIYYCFKGLLSGANNFRQRICTRWD